MGERFLTKQFSGAASKSDRYAAVEARSPVRDASDTNKAISRTLVTNISLAKVGEEFQHPCVREFQVASPRIAPTPFAQILRANLVIAESAVVHYK